MVRGAQRVAGRGDGDSGYKNRGEGRSEVFCVEPASREKGGRRPGTPFFVLQRVG